MSDAPPAREALALTSDGDWRLEDGVVAVRRWSDRDVPALLAACQDPEIVRFTRVPSPYAETDALEFLAAHAAELRAGRAAHFAVSEPSSGELLGSIGLSGLDWANLTGEIGYWTAAPARGRGVAARAVALLAAWALDSLGLARVEILVRPDNRASRSVAASAGFTHEGRLRSYREIKGERNDYEMFSLIAGEAPRARS